MFLFEAILIFLLVKHYLFDFVWQTESMIANKGTYGDWRGIIHSLGHGLGTSIVVFLFLGFWWALMIGFLDGFIHYHIDWVKMKFGSKDIKNPLFWNQFGLDQLAHSLTYVFIAGFVLRSL